MRTLPHHGEVNQFVQGRRTVNRAAKTILLERLNVRFGSRLCENPGETGFRGNFAQFPESTIF